MVGFVLTGHGDFSVGLASSVKMIAGPQEEFDVVPFHEDEAGEFPQKLADAIAASAERNNGVIVFCDLMERHSVQPGHDEHADGSWCGGCRRH